MRPGRIEVHVNRKRAGPPDCQCGEQSPGFVDIFAGDAKRNQQAEKTVERRGERHGDTVGRGKTVGRNRGAEGTREKNAGVGDKQKRRPEDGRTDGEVIFDMAGASAKCSGGLAVFVEAIFAETGVGLLIVVSEIEIVLDERSARERVIANAVSAHPGIQYRQRKQEEHKEKAFCFAWSWLRRRGQTLGLRKDHSEKRAPWKRAVRTSKCAARINTCPGHRVFPPNSNFVLGWEHYLFLNLLCLADSLVGPERTLKGEGANIVFGW